MLVVKLLWIRQEYKLSQHTEDDKHILHRGRTEIKVEGNKIMLLRNTGDVAVVAVNEILEEVLTKVRTCTKV